MILLGWNQLSTIKTGDRAFTTNEMTFVTTILFAIIAVEAVYGSINCSNFKSREKVEFPISYLVIRTLRCSRGSLEPNHVT